MKLETLISELKSCYYFVKDIVVSSRYKEKKPSANEWAKMNDKYGISEEDNIILPYVRDRDDIYKSNICLELRFINDCIEEVKELIVSGDVGKDHVFSWDRFDKISKRLSDD